MRIGHHKYWRVCLIGIWLMGIAATVAAQEQISLLKAGFLTTSDREGFQNKIAAATGDLQLAAIKTKKVFFWSAINCDEACQQQFKPEDTVLIHRWVRDYGVNVVTVQVKAFSLADVLKDNQIVFSEQEISAPGAWFVEMKLRTLDGQTLCLPPPITQESRQERKTNEKEPTMCKFVLRVR